MSSRAAALLLILAPLAGLAGCNRPSATPADRKPVAVVSGTISDAMLQTDQLQAQAPIAEPMASGAAEETGVSERHASKLGAKASGERAAAADTVPSSPEAGAPTSTEPSPAASPKPPPSPAPKATSPG